MQAHWVVSNITGKLVWCTFQIWGLSGSEDRGGVTTVTNSLILRGWVTKVLGNGDEKWGAGGAGGGRVGDNNILTFL